MSDGPNRKRAVFLLTIFISVANLYSQVHFEKLTLKEAMKKAKRTDKAIMIDFYTDWCVPCKELDKHIFQDSTISRFINEKYVSLKINAEKEAGLHLRQKYRVLESYPTVLFLDSEGKEIDRIVGLFRKEEYFKTIQDYAKGENTFPILLAQWKQDKDNPTLIFKIGKKYADRGFWEEASQFYKKAVSYKQYSNNASIWWQLGMLYYSLGKLPEAEKATSQAVKLEPDKPYLKDFFEKIKSELNK